MAAIDSTTATYQINNTEYFYNVAPTGYHPKSMKAYIPKLMAKFEKGKPATGKVSISPSMFCNAKECKVMTSPKVITTQNYVTITPALNKSPSFYGKTGGTVPAFTKLMLEVVNEDIRRMYIIESI